MADSSRLRASFEDSNAIGSKLLSKWGWKYEKNQKTSEHHHSQNINFNLAKEIQLPDEKQQIKVKDQNKSSEKDQSKEEIIIEQINQQLKAIVQSTKYDMISTHQIRFIHQSIMIQEAQKHIKSVLHKKSASTFSSENRDHLYSILAIYQSYLDIYQTTIALDDRQAIQFLFEYFFEEKKKKKHNFDALEKDEQDSSLCSSSSDEELENINFEKERDEEGEETSSFLEQKQIWKPKLSLWNLHDRISSLRREYLSLYESFELWWLSFASVLPYILHGVYYIMFDHGCISNVSEKSSEQLENELKQIFGTTYQLLSKWKPLLESQMFCYMEENHTNDPLSSNNHPPTQQVMQVDETSAFQILVFRVICSAWVQIFSKMSYIDKKDTFRYIQIWNFVKDFSNDYPFLFPHFSIQLLNEAIIKRIIYQCKQISIYNLELLEENETNEQNHHHQHPHDVLIISTKDYFSSWLSHFNNNPSLIDYFYEELLHCYFSLLNDSFNENNLQISASILSWVNEWNKYSDSHSFREKLDYILFYFLKENIQTAQFFAMQAFPSDIFRFVIYLSRKQLFSDDCLIKYLCEYFFPSWKAFVSKYTQDLKNIDFSFLYSWYLSWKNEFTESLFEIPEIYQHFYEVLVLFYECLAKLKIT